MGEITSHEQLFTLNEILPYLLKGKFQVSEIHLTHLATTKLKEDGTTDVGGAFSTYNIYKHKGVYKAIHDFLIENGFAKSITENDVEYLLLTLKGEYLSSHGSLNAYNSCLQITLTDDELKERTTLLLQEITPFGDFCISPNKRSINAAFLSTIPGGTDKERLDYISQALLNQVKDHKEVIIKEHIDLIKDERVAEYLVHRGFATNRYDIKSDDKIYRQLTDTGRKLKQLGSIVEFEKWELSEKRKQDTRESENDTLRQTNILSGKIQQNLLSINRWIALAGIVAALYYLSQMVDYFSGLILKHTPLYYGVAVTIYLLLLGGLSGVGLTIGVPRLLKAIKKKRTK